jgi:hypothetical protein
MLASSLLVSTTLAAPLPILGLQNYTEALGLLT